MTPDRIRTALRFYFITDDGAANLPALQQVRVAVEAGATMVQYRNKAFTLNDYDEVVAIRQLCAERRIPFVINDHVLLARAVGADGVHVGQEDAAPALARRILGPGAVVGISVSSLKELETTDLSMCDYIGSGPVYATDTKADAKAVLGLNGLRAIVGRASLPVAAIGGIGVSRALDCLAQGAAGVAVISCITRSRDPVGSAAALARACGLARRRRSK